MALPLQADIGMAGVAGYLFDDEGPGRFAREWNAVKQEYNRDYHNIVPDFHATDCCDWRDYDRLSILIPELRS